MALKLHFPENGWEEIEKNWSAWWAGELERALVVIECVDLRNETTLHYASTFLGNYGLEMAADELLDMFIPRLEATHYLGDAFPRYWPNFGPGIVSAFAGADLYAVNATTWFSANSSELLSNLHLVLREDNPWWQRVKSVTQSAVERWGSQLSIGFTDLGGNLDILAALRGTQRFLLDLLDNPQDVDRLVLETNRLWLRCYWALYSMTQGGRGVTCWGP